MLKQVSEFSRRSLRSVSSASASSKNSDGGHGSNPVSPRVSLASRVILREAMVPEAAEGVVISPMVSRVSGSRESMVEEGEEIVDYDFLLKELLKHRIFKLDDFDFKATVGVGSFGRVRVVSVADGTIPRPFALKIMKKSVVMEKKQVEHVNSERAILMTINHPFVVNLFTHFQDERRLFLLLDFVNGGELFSHLRLEGRIQDEHATFYTGEITLALEYLHIRSIIYRDLKPENILLDCEGHVKITDFGFAKVVQDRTWTLCGTAEYLAPEIIQSKGHGAGADWWALGILMFEMLAGYPPFAADTPFDTYQLVIAGEINFPKHLTSPSVELIKRLAEPDRSKRYGCLKAGPEDIKRHRWFKGMDWQKLLKRQMLAPHLPGVKAADDTTMFDRYPESTESSAPQIEADAQEQFQAFTPESTVFPDFEESL